MESAFTRITLLLGVLSLAASAHAQQAPPSEPFRKWELGGALGFRLADNDDPVIPQGFWMAEAGRYWTAHIKTSVAVTTAGQTTFSGVSSFTPLEKFTTTTTGPATVSAIVAYQFFDNVFVHPYIFGGARLATVSETIDTISTRSPYLRIGTETRSPHLEGRPIIGGGFKSYFANGRAFMRTDLLLSIDPRGESRPILQLGAGVDF